MTGRFAELLDTVILISLIWMSPIGKICFSLEEPKKRLFFSKERKICFRGYFFDSFGRKAKQVILQYKNERILAGSQHREDIQRWYAKSNIQIEKEVGFEGWIELSRGLKEIDILAELSGGRTLRLARYYIFVYGAATPHSKIEQQANPVCLPSAYFCLDAPQAEELIITEDIFLEVRGWVFDTEGNPPSSVIVKNPARVFPCKAIARSDVKAEHPILKDIWCGFLGRMPLDENLFEYIVEAEFPSGKKLEIGKFSARSFNREEREKWNQDRYKEWFVQYGQFVGREEELLRRRIKGFAYKPIFSVVMVVGLGDRLEGVLATVRSVVGQWYEQWELLLVLYGGRKLTVEELRGVGGEGKLRVIEVNSSEKGKAKEVGVREACGEYCLLLDSGEELVAHALYVFVEALQEDKRLDLLFGDEDQLSDGGEVHSPVFKPGFNYDLLRSVNYLGRPVVFRKQKAMEVGGFDEGLEGAEEWDLYLRMTTDRVDGHGVCHLPYVLCHRGGEAVARGGVVKEEVEREVVWRDCTRRGVGVERIERLKGGWRIRYGIGEAKPLVSIVMPSKCQLTYLRPCVESIMS
ncbi:glycosyltransferase, partial [Candidatus Methylacidiphilum fumarolicum]|uniref:glycosyltransferase n=1 Tax=Candidatus Methylacidiphilum fumarolicum TaxID=591154 RepID=UPI00106D108D